MHSTSGGHGVSVLVIMNGSGSDTLQSTNSFTSFIMAHQGYLCKFCELFCGHSSSSLEFGINLGLGTV
jgi:hypothetical protein